MLPSLPKSWVQVQLGQRGEARRRQSCSAAGRQGGVHPVIRKEGRSHLTFGDDFPSRSNPLGRQSQLRVQAARGVAETGTADPPLFGPRSLFERINASRDAFSLSAQIRLPATRPLKRSRSSPRPSLPSSHDTNAIQSPGRGCLEVILEPSRSPRPRADHTLRRWPLQELLVNPSRTTPSQQPSLDRWCLFGSHSAVPSIS